MSAQSSPTVYQRNETPRVRGDPDRQFRVISYNMLARVYSGAHRHPDQDPALFDWAKRLATFHAQFLAFDADVLCLQEVVLPEFDADFGAFFRAHGYAYELQNDRGRRKTHVVGNAIVYRAGRLALETVASRSRTMLACLRWRTSSSPAPAPDAKSGLSPLLYVASVHLQGDPYAVNVRLSQVQKLLQQMQRQQQAHLNQGKNNVADVHCAMVIAGDFNQSGRRHFLDLALADGFVPRDHVDEGTRARVLPGGAADFRSDYRFADVYRDDSDPTYVEAGAGGRGGEWRIDYIYHSRPGLSVVQRMQVLLDSEREEVRREGLPRRDLPSDHLAIGCVLQREDVPLHDPAEARAAKAAREAAKAAKRAARLAKRGKGQGQGQQHRKKNSKDQGAAAGKEEAALGSWLPSCALQ